MNDLLFVFLFMVGLISFIVLLPALWYVFDRYEYNEKIRKIKLEEELMCTNLEHKKWTYCLLYFLVFLLRLFVIFLSILITFIHLKDAVDVGMLIKIPEMVKDINVYPVDTNNKLI